MQFPLYGYGYILEGMAKDFQDLNNGQVLEGLTFKTDKMSEMLEKHFSLFEFLEDDLRVSGSRGLVIIIKNKLLAGEFVSEVEQDGLLDSLESILDSL